MPKQRDNRDSARFTSWRSPAAQASMAPPASVTVSSGTIRAGFEVLHGAEPVAGGGTHRAARLKEKARGVISGTLMPQSTQAIRREGENSLSPPPSVLMMTTSAARVSAVLDGLGQTPLGAAAHDESVHHDVDSSGCAADSRRVSSSTARTSPSNPHARQSAFPDGGQLLPELALAAAHDGREDVDPARPRARP